ncbi:hypothetical protein K0B04_02160 [Patescibacteria group bacterium]|nr:hypothetical protein [Patescibacteria group bacterium]
MWWEVVKAILFIGFVLPIIIYLLGGTAYLIFSYWREVGLVILGIIVLIMLYSYRNSLDNKRRKEQYQNAYFNCMYTVRKVYIDDWNKTCSFYGLNDECELPNEIANVKKYHYTQAVNTCESKYPNYLR